MVLLAINAVASKHYLIETKGDGESGYGDKDYALDDSLLEEGEAPVDGLVRLSFTSYPLVFVVNKMK